jgi:WXG100 family type VII secretion target
LAQFSTAMQAVTNNTQSISDAYESIQQQYGTVEEIWTSPAGMSFADITATIDSAMTQLNTVLSSIYSAMESSYTTYLTEEQTNAHNFTGGS